MRDAFVNQLTELARNDSDVMFLTGDLGFGVFDDFAKEFPDQYLNVGVAEQNMTGIAAGLGLEGKKVFTYSIANFSTLRCLEQIRNDAAYHEVNLTVVASGGGFTYGALGMSHHATEDLAIMRALPDITVLAPSTAWEAYHATKAIIQTNGVGYLRIEKGGIQEPVDDKTNFTIGKSIEMCSGKDLTIIACGRIIEECLAAAKLLKKRNISANVVSMHSVKPIDAEAILFYAKTTNNIITVEEHNKSGGLGSAVSEVLTDNFSTCRLSRIALEDKYSSVVGSQNYLRTIYKLDAIEIEKKSVELLNMKK